MRTLITLVFTATLSVFAGVQVRFDPQTPAVGPFPNDFLRVADATQRTGYRVNMPLPDCQAAPSDCAELMAVNQLDGFNVQARINVQFTGKVDVRSLRNGVFYVWLDAQWPIAVNRVTWEPATLTMTAKSEEPLLAGRRYAVIVTDAVVDEGGRPVESDEGFDACLRKEIGGTYCVDLSNAVKPLTAMGYRVKGGSIFTTQSATGLMEAAQEVAALMPSNYKITNTVAAKEVSQLVMHAQVKTAGTLFEDQATPLNSGTLALGKVSKIAFGTVGSATLDAAGQVAPTALGYHVLLPEGTKPAGGWPVVLAGHGLGDTRLMGPTLLALSFVSQGYAVLAIDAVGHGYGPKSTYQIRTATGVVEIPSLGRGVDADGDGTIGASEGCVVATGAMPTALRDCLRQTAADWLMVAQAVKSGMDLDGDGRPDLDATQMAYWGQSLGAMYGTIFTALEPGVKAAVLNVGGGSVAEIMRTSATFRPLVTAYLAQRQPMLLNAGLGFDEQYAVRGDGVTLLTKPGAAQLQDVFERLEWVQAAGDPATYAPWIKWNPKYNASYKRVLFQIAIGDMTVPNPANSLLIRAADGLATTSIYRHDLARGIMQNLPRNPHAFASFIATEAGDLAAGLISSAALNQAAAFVMSGTTAVPDVNTLLAPLFGRKIIETAVTLPEGLNFQTNGVMAPGPDPVN